MRTTTPAIRTALETGEEINRAFSFCFGCDDDDDDKDDDENDKSDSKVSCRRLKFQIS
jgi:hypothetical protein